MSKYVEVGGARRSQGAMTSLVSWNKVLLVGNGRGRRRLESDHIGSECHPMRLGLTSYQVNSHRWFLGRGLVECKCCPWVIL